MLSPHEPDDEARTPLGEERFRPRYHFTPRRNWMNDPNGLVFFDDEYHLFFQYNPFGKDWGHMSWGHAVSADLVHWRELDVAIPETDQMIFSGSVIVDHENRSGLGDDVHPPLLAFFTAFDATRGVQSQNLAYSHDRGRSFTHYAGNPIIDLDLADFRDPKLFYHGESAAWVMLVVLAREHVVQFYRSENLIDWSLSGTFGPSGSISGQWECPDLIRLPVEGFVDKHAWVLKVDVDDGLVDGGSGAQYFVGGFDGHCFKLDPDLGSENSSLVDFGPDFYAAVTWSDLPSANPGPIWIGWQSNHQSGKRYPTDPWRGAMSLPRELFLFEEEERLCLGQRPVGAIELLRGVSTRSPRELLRSGESRTISTASSSFEQQFSLSGKSGTELALTVNDNHGALVTVTVDFDQRQLTFERNTSLLAPRDDFRRITTARLPRPGEVNLQIFFDGSLIEIFVDGGRRVYSGCLFPDGQAVVELSTITGEGNVELQGSWPMKRSIDFGSESGTAH